MKVEANLEYVVYNDSIGFRGEITKERLMIALKGKPAETLVSVDSYQEDGTDECWITTRWITKANEHGQYTIDDLLPGHGRQEGPDAKTTYYKATGKSRGWGQWIAASTCDNGFTTWDHLYPLTLGLIYWPSRTQWTQRTEAQPVVNSVEELDALSAGTLVKSGGREFYKTSYVELPWILPYGVDRFGSSYLSKDSKVTVIHRPVVES